jgi:hypothetical protein
VALWVVAVGGTLVSILLVGDVCHAIFFFFFSLIAVGHRYLQVMSTTPLTTSIAVAVENAENPGGQEWLMQKR